jgi:ATP-dependent Lon protease
VLPVGGIKEKVMAAHRAGIERVILPAHNQRDVDDIPEDTRAAVKLVFVSDMLEALDAALEPVPMPDVDGGIAGSWKSGDVA